MPKLIALAGALLALVAVDLLWPFADKLFAGHMAQHLLLIVVAAPLMVLGGIEIRIPPLLAWALFITVFLFWHWPLAFQWAARNRWAELLEMGSLLIAALSFWSRMLGRGRLNDGARVLMVMTAAVLTDLPGVVMVFAPRAFCVLPHGNAAWFGLTPLADQQLAGLLMWVPANLVFFGIATFLFFRWISDPRPVTP
jgi:putative membrane protein